MSFNVWSSDGVGSSLPIGRATTFTPPRYPWYVAVVVIIRLQQAVLHYKYNFAAACIAASLCIHFLVPSEQVRFRTLQLSVGQVPTLYIRRYVAKGDATLGTPPFPRAPPRVFNKCIVRFIMRDDILANHNPNSSSS
jgi:hypothetical protein